MTDEETITSDVMATPEQVLAAGGVSKRRRGASSTKRRSPSGQMRRAPTPEPHEDLSVDPEEELELKSEVSPTKSEVSPTKAEMSSTKPAVSPTKPAISPAKPEISPTKSSTIKRISTAEKIPVTKRSQSSPGEGRQSLASSITPSELRHEPTTTKPAEKIYVEKSTDLSPTKVVATKRKSTSEKTLLTKRSQSSPGEGRVPMTTSVTTGDLGQEISTDSRRKKLPSDRPRTDNVDNSTPVPELKKSTGAVPKSYVVDKSDNSLKTKTPKQNDTVAEPEEIYHETKRNIERQIKELEDSIQATEVKVPPEESLNINTTEDVNKQSSSEEKSDAGELATLTQNIDRAEKTVPEATWGPFLREVRKEWKNFVAEHSEQWNKIISQRNRCVGALLVMFIYCGLGGLVFRFTEGAFEAFYKCGVKRVKRDFVDSLWLGSHHLLEDEWKSQARKKLMELETQLHAAHEAGVTSYSGQRAWSFLNAIVYCLTVITTIGYGHISPSTTTGRAITIVYAIFGIPMFLILLADFGKLFTRGIKFIWAFVRRVYYTGSCRKVRRTVPVQEVMKGVQLVYDFATFRRPSQMVGEVGEDAKQQAPIARPEDLELQVPLNQPQLNPPPPQANPITNIPLDGREPPGTPALSTFEVDDEFNLPISVAIVILLIYIFVGATIYWTWETWGFFESFYFVFISMSTIGFGDFVPQHPMYMMASIVYLVFGLALTSMCINVVQEKLSDSFRQASAKIGATIGLRVAEEDGTMTPVPPVQIELPEVHNTITKSQST